MLKKVFIKEYEYFTLYGIYLNGKLIYKTAENKIKDIYKTKAIKSIKADVILRGEL
jgi:hypothetical protein